MELKQIQQKLNKLCSQHDEFMALLELNDYLANFKSFAQNNRTVSSKIAQLEQQIREIQESQNAQRSQHKELGSMKLEKLKRNIANFQQKLLNYGSQLVQLDLSAKKIEAENETFSFNPEFSKANISAETTIQKEISMLQSSIATFKAELDYKIIEIDSIVSAVCAPDNEDDPTENNFQEDFTNKIDISSLINESFQPYTDSYDQLIHEIMLYEVQFPIPSLQPFIRHNSEDIKDKINWLYSKVNIHEQLNDSEFSILKSEYETISFRVKALKNYLLCELLQLYQQVFMILLRKNAKQKQINFKASLPQQQGNYKTGLNCLEIFLRKLNIKENISILLLFDENSQMIFNFLQLYEAQIRKINYYEISYLLKPDCFSFKQDAFVVQTDKIRFHNNKKY